MVSHLVINPRVSMISGAQFSSARAEMGWKITRLSNETQVNGRTIIRMEATGGGPKSTATNINIGCLTLQAAGIEFIGTPDNQPSICLNYVKN